MGKGAMLELASRVEAASGPDRELDAEIGRFFAADFLGYVPDEPATGCAKFTASLDAAMLMVPPKRGWRVSYQTKYNPKCYATVGKIGVYAATPALALTAACLRALASQVDHAR